MKPSPLFKVLFLGTGEFSKHSLEYFFSDSRFQIEAVLTKKPAPAGRGMKLQHSPVYETAQKRGVPVFTPDQIRSPADVPWLSSIKADAAVVSAYGLILPPFFIERFKNKIVNLHTSLLPRFRGASPIQYALLKGDKETGLTLQELSEKMDQGQIIHQIPFQVTDEMSALDVLEKMKPLSNEMLRDYLIPYLKGELKGSPQDPSKASFAPKIKNEDLKINWSESLKTIFNHIRAFTMDGGAYTFYKEKRLKIFKSKRIEGLSHQQKAGTILSRDENHLHIACGGGGVLSLLEVQMEAKKRQGIQDFARGSRMRAGELLK